MIAAKSTSNRNTKESTVTVNTVQNQKDVLSSCILTKYFNILFKIYRGSSKAAYIKFQETEFH